MLNILKSYLLRIKRTPAGMVIILCPLIFTGLFSVYLLSATGLKGVELAYFFGAYTILAGFSVSFLIPMLYESDKKAGDYANDLRIGICRKKLFFARFIFISILLMAIEGIAILPFILFLHFYGINIQILDLAVYAMIGSVGLISMVPVYQFLSLKFNYTGSILAGTIFTLAAVLLGTTDLGTGIWYYFPFVYPIKLIYGYVSGLFNVDTVIFYLFISFLLSIVSVGILSFWYNRWDGISKMEE